MNRLLAAMGLILPALALAHTPAHLLPGTAYEVAKPKVSYALYGEFVTGQEVFVVKLSLDERFAVPVRAFGGYLEGGVGFEVAPGWSVGALLAVDVMVVGMPGFGFGPRVFFTARL